MSRSVNERDSIGDYRSLVEMRAERKRLVKELTAVDNRIAEITDSLIQQVQESHIHRSRESYPTDLMTYLDGLRSIQGMPSARAIAQGTGNLISHTTVSQVFRRSRIVSWKTTQVLGEYLGADPVVLRELWREYISTVYVGAIEKGRRKHE